MQTGNFAFSWLPVKLLSAARIPKLRRCGLIRVKPRRAGSPRFCVFQEEGRDHDWDISAFKYEWIYEEEISMRRSCSA